MAESSPTPIAIVGMGCRLPGDVCDTEGLWDLLAKGKNTWSPVPPERFNEEAFYHPNPGNNGTTNHRGGHFLSKEDNLAAFDAGFFGMSAAEAQATDPQQRLLLEVSYEAFENAGIPVEQIRGSDTAVYAAMFTRDYDRNIYKDPNAIPKYHTTGCGEAILSNRISYIWDLKGPSMTLDTGCSGSMVALHQACQSLRVGESSAALACGVSLILNPDHMIGMSNLYMLNDNGRSYPFDARGAGYGRGEGATAVVLKRLDDALEAGDNIRAVIRNTSINHDGKTNGITLPNCKAQEELQRRSHQQAGLDPCAIQYIEAHGTGTAAGDVAELQAIAQAFSRNRAPSNPIYVGSIKSNIGHLESSSGLAGLIKTVLMLEKGYILPNADFEEPKLDLKLDQWKIRIPQKLEPLQNLQRASVNSFGYGGVNAYAILECAPAQMADFDHNYSNQEYETCANDGNSLTEARKVIQNQESAPGVHEPAPVLCCLSEYDYAHPDAQKRPVDKIGNICGNRLNSRQMLKCGEKLLFVITASTHEQVLDSASKFRSWASAESRAELDLQSLAYTMATRRSLHQWRYAFQASSKEEFLLHLNQRLVSTESSKALRMLFVFTGQGAQWHAMGRELNLKYPVFRESLHRSDEILRDLGTIWTLERELGRSEEDSRVHQSEIAQPSSTALQIALVDLLTSFGIRPATVIGHSSGEIVAAYAAGVISHRTALKISFSRSLLSMLCKQRFSSKGAMLSVGLGESQVSPLLLETRRGVVSLACVNSSVGTTVSGDEPAIVDLQGRLNDLGIFNRKLRVDTAYHSHHMRRVAHDYLCSLGSLDTNAINDQVVFISSVTGMQKKKDFGPDYWVDNLVSKVRFSDALKEYCNLERASSRSKGVHHLLIELGPHGTLAGPIKQTMTEAADSLAHTYLPVLTRGRDAVQSILSLSERLFEHGYPVDIQTVNCLSKLNSRLRVLPNLPTYPWDHSKTYWHESRLSRDYRMRQHPCHDLLGTRITSSPSQEPSWRCLLSLDSLPWLADHAIDGLITFPGAGYVCMAIEGSKQLAEEKSFSVQSFVLQSVSFMKALVIPPAPKTIELQICFRPRQLGLMIWDEFRVYALSEDDVWHEHCRGRILASPASSPNPQFSQSSKCELSEILKESQRLSDKEVYSRLQANGNLYGPCFACIKELQIAHSQAKGYLTIPDIRSKMPAGYQQPHIIHPTTLDALLHTALPLYEHQCGSGSVMPVSIEELSISLHISSTPGEGLAAAVELYPDGERSAYASIFVSGVGEVAKERPSLMISRMQLRGVGAPERNCTISSERRNMAYQLQWLPEMTSMAQKCPETALDLKAGAKLDYDKSLINSSNSFTNGNRRVLDKSGHLGHEIKLIIAPGCQGLADLLTTLLHEDNHKVSSERWASRAASAQTFYIILDNSEKPFLQSPATTLFRHITETVKSVFNILWVSAQVESIDPSSVRDPKSALTTGFARSARAEHEQLRLITLDIQDDIGKDLSEVSRAIAEVFRRSINGDEELEYLYRESQLLIPRLFPDRQLNEVLAQVGKPQLEDVLYLRSKNPLKLELDSFKFQNGFCFVDGSSASDLTIRTEVEVEALAHSFDLRHIDQIKGRMKHSIPFICEFAGFVRAIDSQAETTVKRGDAVFGWNLCGPAYLSHPHTELCNVTHVPRNWSLPIAAAMVLPLMVGYYSLVEIARLQKGQSVLVHGTAGIYGQTAIAMAQNTGAKVLATVSSPTQREDLAIRFNLPSSHILLDRDMNLEREILRLTDKTGVDVVLATPTGGQAPDLGGCMAALGVYVQILPARENTHVTPTFFSGPTVTYVPINVDTIAIHRPEKLSHSLEKAVSMLPAGFTPTANVKCIAMSHIEDAVAESQDLEAFEKIVLTADADTNVRVRRTTQADSKSGVYNLRSDATYVIAGGLGDLGQEICSLMAIHGAKHLVLLSRRSLTKAKVDSFQESLQQYSPGLRLYVISCDISDRTAILSLAGVLESLMLPAVKGVFQAASILHDRVLEGMTAEDWQLPLRTKMYGTRNIDEAFKSSSLDFFVMLSSLSGVVGTRGQANYAAGNTYQDAFAQCREYSQTAYIALDLGMIEYSTAYEDRTGKVRAQNLLQQGWIPIQSEQIAAIFEWVLTPETWRRGSGQYAIGIDGSSIYEAENATPTSKSAMFTHVRGVHEIKAPVGTTSSLGHRMSIMAADTLEEAQKTISDATNQKIVSLISVGDEFDEHRSLQDSGLDSLTAIEVKNFIRKEFDATVHASEILDEPCLAALSSKIASRSGVLQKKFGSPPKAWNVDGASQEKLTNGIHHLSEVGKLPALPLPSIEDTMDLYLTSARPFLDAQKFERTSEAIRIFKGQTGKFLQEKLESRNEAPEINNWQYDLQVSGIYLRRRSPIHPFGTFYAVHLLTTHSQAEKAAIIAETAYAFQKKLETNQLEPDYLNDERLCPQSLNWLFNACREPHKFIDRIKKHEHNEYLVVLRRGHIFKVLLEQESQPLTRANLKGAFDEILNLSTQSLPSVGTLTADERDSWAELRAVAMSMNLTNKDALDTIEAAAFVICLDDSSPATPTERCNTLLLGDPRNRWSDKTLQFVVCANGVSGYICEHSMLDMASLRQINNSITTAITESPVQPEINRTIYGHLRILEEVTFQIDNVLVENIDRVYSHVVAAFKPVEFAHFKLPSMGNMLLRSRKMPSKSGIQSVIQLASLLYYGVQFPSSETLTMMLFRSGRLDWMQSVSPAMFKFCETAFNEKVTLSQRSKMLREAASTHTSIMTRISRGRGFAAHLEALREIAQQEESLPEFFDDPTWEMMRVLSPRKLKTDASENLKAQEAGFFMPDPESVFVHYEIDESECRFFVQSTEGRTDGFCQALEKAAEQIRHLLEEE